MDQPILVCLFDCEQRAGGTPFREPFEQIQRLHILGEYSTWEELEECSKRYDLDVIAVNLDGDEEAALRIVERVSRQIPGCGVIGVSKATDPQAIIRAMRAGCAQFVCRPVDIEDLKSALSRIRASHPLTAKGSQRICVIGAGGGAGATIISCNLAMELATLSGRKCGLVDLNLEFGDICCAFDCRPRFTIADACADPEKLDRSVLKSVLHDLPSNVSILARPNDIEESDAVTPDALELIFKLLDDMYPNVVVDLPRATSFLSAVALAKADRVLIVGQLSVPIIRNATRVYECVMQMGADENCVEIVLNRYNANFERITIEDVEKHFARPVFATIPNDYKNVAAAVDMGHPIGADSPTCPARKAIHDMARKILGDQVVVETNDKGGEGFLSKLWKRPAEKPGS